MNTNNQRKRIAVLTGAGVSKESGLDTYRDRDGMWQKQNPMKLVSVEGWEEDKQTVLDFHNSLRRTLLTVEPNSAHKLLAQLEKDFDVTIITQNIDNLHERGGSTDIIHLHGELTKVCSSRDSEDPRYVRELLPLDVEIKLGDKAGDGSQLRPYIVWFGEAVPMMERAAVAMEQADIVIVVGTSLQVYPAAGLTRYAFKATHKFLIDPSDMDVPVGYEHIKAPATVGMKLLMSKLMELK